MLRFYLMRARAELARLEQERRLLNRFPTLRVSRGVEIISPERLEVADNVLIQHNAIIHCGGLDWSDGQGSIKIGPDSVISYGSVLFGAGGIDIGPRFDCGPGCMIFSSRSLHESPPGGDRHLFAKVVIGDDVTLYAGVIVGPGVTIGNGAAIGAGSVVLGDVPANALYAGVPARRIRDIA
jgi:acetyltransferase-like isoleucine patch superfamily enzyme